MGRNRMDFIKNRCDKIERNYLKRKNKKYNPYKIFYKNNENKLSLNNTQKILRDNNFYYKNIEKTDTINIEIPKLFSLIDNPNETIDILKKTNYILEKTVIDYIYFDYSNCEKLDLAASVIMDKIVLNGLKYKKKCRVKVRLAGNIPKTYEAQELFLNSGLVKHLEISKIESPQVVRLDPFDKIYDKNMLLNNTLRYYNSCLNVYGYKLNTEGLTHFGILIGEVIDNMEQHSGEHGEWFVSGHFLKNNEQEVGKGELTFISFGNTIYESLKSESVVDTIKKKLESHTKSHKTFFNNKWTEELSWNVFALQYKISSKKDAENIDRGTGTIKFIDSFTALGNTIGNDVPKMLILSGNSHITLDGTYKMQKKIINSEAVEVIAFNVENDLKKRPDPKYVRNLEHKFPGTIISVNFFVDKKYLDLIKENEINEK